eukprot:gene7797-650_t
MTTQGEGSISTRNAVYMREEAVLTGGSGFNYFCHLFVGPLFSTLSLLALFEGHQGRVWKVDWHGSTLASSSTDSCVRLWQQTGNKTWSCVTELQGPQRGTIRSVRFSASGRQLVTSSFDGTVGVWDRTGDTGADWECSATLEGHENEVKDACFSSSGEYLASCSRDKTVWIWEYLEDSEEYDCCSILNDHTQDVKCLRWHPILDILASGSYDNTICLYKPDPDAADWVRVDQLNGHESTVWCMAFNSDGSLLASGSDDKTIRIWKPTSNTLSSDLATAKWTCIITLSGYHTRSVYSIDWSPLTNLLVSGCGDNHVRVFRQTNNDSDKPDFEQVCTLQAHNQDINSVAWCRSPEYSLLLASASDDETIKLLELSAAVLSI